MDPTELSKQISQVVISHVLDQVVAQSGEDVDIGLILDKDELARIIDRLLPKESYGSDLS